MVNQFLEAVKLPGLSFSFSLSLRVVRRFRIVRGLHTLSPDRSGALRCSWAVPSFLCQLRFIISFFLYATGCATTRGVHSGPPT